MCEHYDADSKKHEVRYCHNCGKVLTDLNTRRYGSKSVCDDCYVGYFDGTDCVEGPEERQ